MPPKKNIQKRERVELREGHVARADHQRDEVVGHADDHRHAEQEDHRRAVHGEERVETCGDSKVLFGTASWMRISRRLEPGDHEEQQAATMYMIPSRL